MISLIVSILLLKIIRFLEYPHIYESDVQISLLCMKFFDGRFLRHFDKSGLFHFLIQLLYILCYTLSYPSQPSKSLTLKDPLCFPFLVDVVSKFVKNIFVITNNRYYSSLFRSSNTNILLEVLFSVIKLTIVM